MADLEEIKSMFVGGMSVSAIAEELEMTPARVSQLLTALGLSDSAKRRSSLSRLDDEQVAEAIQMYLDDRSVVEIILKFHLNYNSFYRLLREHGIEYRARSSEAKNDRAERMDLAIRMYIKGVPISQVEIETGIRQPMLHRELHLRGVPLRGHPFRRKKGAGALLSEDDRDLIDLEELTGREVALLNEGDKGYLETLQRYEAEQREKAIDYGLPVSVEEDLPVDLGPGGLDTESASSPPARGRKKSAPQRP
jgi:transposase